MQFHTYVKGSRASSLLSLGPPALGEARSIYEDMKAAPQRGNGASYQWSFKSTIPDVDLLAPVKPAHDCSPRWRFVDSTWSLTRPPTERLPNP